jgi:predicted amidophosphoribosyltransferase
MARCLEKSHGIRVLRILQRTGGKPQKSLDLAQRRENLLGRIRLARAGRRGTVPAIPPPEAVLLDDIFTTGATADACARALLDGGCRKVSVITLAIEQ